MENPVGSRCAVRRGVFSLGAALSLTFAHFSVPALADTPYSLGWKAQQGSASVDCAFAVQAIGNDVYVLGISDDSLAGPKLGIRDAVLFKYTSSGLTVWGKQFGTPALDEASGMGADAAGNLYISGTTTGNFAAPPQGLDTWVAKVNSAGGFEWKAQYGRTETFGLAVDPLGNSYLAGHGQVGASQDARIVKYNNAGVHQWTREFGTAQEDYLHGAVVDVFGNVIVTGYTAGSLAAANAGGEDAMLAKYDSDGNQMWVKQYGTAGADRGWEVAADALGNIYMAGTSGSDGFLRQYAPDGTPGWVRAITTAASDTAYGVTVDAMGRVFVTGNTWGSIDGPNLGDSDNYVLAFDSLGNELWRKQYGTSAQDSTNAITTDAAGNLYAVGRTGGSFAGAFQGGYEDIFVAQLPVPEPGSLGLLAAGLISLGVRRRGWVG